MNMVKRENQNKRFFNIVAGVYDRGIVGKWLFGIDISEKMLSVARKKVRYAHFFKLSVLDINKKFKENSFDYIFVIDAFHHFPEQEEVMHNFHKILKNRGAL